MISQISNVSFLVYTLLCMGSWNTDSWMVWSQNLGVLKGCKNFTVCNVNANSPEAANFQNYIFCSSKCRPCTVPPGVHAPFALPPITTVCDRASVCTFCMQLAVINAAYNNTYTQLCIDVVCRSYIHCNTANQLTVIYQTLNFWHQKITQPVTHFCQICTLYDSLLLSYRQSSNAWMNGLHHIKVHP